MNAEDINIIYLGEKFKLVVNLPPMHDLTMDDYDFTINAYCVPYKKQVVAKQEAIRDDESNYIVCLDSTVLGPGRVKLEVRCQIPDKDFSDGYRPSICRIFTKHVIVK